MKRREAWFEGQLDLDPSRLVFIDETWASTNMARKNGRAPRGERLRASVPHGHWKTTTFVAGLRLCGLTAPMVLDGPINGVLFQAYIDQVLVPTLSPGDIFVMDNLGSHKGASLLEQGADPVPQSVYAAFRSLAQERLELREGVLDRVEVGAVGRQVK